MPISWDSFRPTGHFLCVALLVSPILPAEDLGPSGGSLPGAIRQAIATHPYIAAARDSASAAGADLDAAKWLRAPSLSVQETILTEQSQYSALQQKKRQLSGIIDQPVWTGGRISGQIDKASQLKVAAAAKFDEVALTVAINVSQAYFEVQRLQQRREILTGSLAEHRRMVDTMQRRFEQEVSPQSDLQLAQSRHAQIEQQLSLTRALLGAAQQRLRELVGDERFDPTDAISAPVVIANNTPDEEIRIALDFDPQRRRLQAESEASSAEVQIIKASTKPHVSLQYSYNETYKSQFGIVMKAQIDNGLSRMVEADAQRLRQKASVMQIAAAERELRNLLTADRIEYESATSRRGIADEAAATTQLITESDLRQFTSGRRSWLDVMNAVRESMTARLDAVETRMSAMASGTRLMLRTGLWQPQQMDKKEP